MCGYFSHFSIGVVVLTPIGNTPVIEKHFNMGGACPNDCSGAGLCTQSGRCVCYTGFTGYACDARSCPVSTSWDVVFSQTAAVAHSQVVCSNRGSCSAATGTCTCNPGFTGAACQRMACPHNCNGNGRCLSAGELPAVESSASSAWELSRISTCLCDGGWYGPDCSLRYCPFSADPEVARVEGSVGQTHQVQTLTLDFGSLPTSTGGLLPVATITSAQLIVGFTAHNGVTAVTNTISNIMDPVFGAPAMAAALSSLPGFVISDVTVTGSAPSAGSVAYAITFDGTSLAGSPSTALNVGANTVAGEQGGWGGNHIVKVLVCAHICAKVTDCACKQTCAWHCKFNNVRIRIRVEYVPISRSYAFCGHDCRGTHMLISRALPTAPSPTHCSPRHVPIQR